MYQQSEIPIVSAFRLEAPSEEGVQGRVRPEYAAKGRKLQRSESKTRVEKCWYMKYIIRFVLYIILFPS